MLTLEDIQWARERIRGRVHRTPLVPSATLSREFGCRVSLKLECLQKTGSFKPRGAFNKLLALKDEERARGVVAVSGGNHAQGVAYAARELGIEAVICMPGSTPAHYLEATRGYGARIILCDNIHAAFARADALAKEGSAYVHPFDDPLVAAGQGTAGLEIAEDAPDATHCFVSIGGGGLLAGVAAALKGRIAEIDIIGVETEGADAMARAIDEGKIVELPAITSIARTLGAPKVSAFTLEHCQQLAEGVAVVSDAEAVSALVFLLERCKVLTEPAASCVLAAARKMAWAPEDHVVLLLCGGNATVEDIGRWTGGA
ncbi:MAG: threonine/serine dehydratase [Gemmataceae bacterium]|nr:threonine/serine dehydratase [Gemmataceae bacterium]